MKSRSPAAAARGTLPELLQTLQHRRRKRDLTLEALAARTRIRRRYLEAIERGAVNELPEGLYRRSFIRTYLQALGVTDPHEIEATTGRLMALGSPAAAVPAKPAAGDATVPSAGGRAWNLRYLAVTALALVLLASLGIARQLLAGAEGPPSAPPATTAAPVAEPGTDTDAAPLAPEDSAPRAAAGHRADAEQQSVPDLAELLAQLERFLPVRAVVAGLAQPLERAGPAPVLLAAEDDGPGTREIPSVASASPVAGEPVAVAAARTGAEGARPAGARAGAPARSAAASARSRPAPGPAVRPKPPRAARQTAKPRTPGTRSRAGRAKALLRATGTVRVTVLSGTGRGRSRQLHKGQTLELSGPTSLMVSDARAVELSVGGKRLPRFGKKGRPSRIRIDPQQLAD
jgi:cytoskeletal protein RodZ